MARYVVFSREKRARADLDQVASEPGVMVIDEGLGRTLLVEATEGAIDLLRAKLPGLVISEEVVHSRPGPVRQRVVTDEPEAEPRQR